MAYGMSKCKIIESIADYSKIRIGSSVFTDDTWDLTQFINTKSLVNAMKKINFSYIKSMDIKHTAKLYAYYLLGKNKPRTVKNRINGELPIFIEYSSVNGITSFSQITSDIILDFAMWVKNAKNYNSKFGYMCSHVLEDIIRIGQIRGWNVPENDVLSGVRACDIWGAKKLRTSNKIKPIPEDVFEQILYHAVHDEKDIVTKSGIIIQSQTGLRINEVLSIEEGCIATTQTGESYLEVTITKTENEPIKHKVLVNKLVVDVVNELSEYSKDYRKKMKTKLLFIAPTYGGSFPKVNTWSCGRLTTFIKRWDIRDKNGELYPLKSHQFRATFVKHLIIRKVPIAYIMKQFKHVSIEMTSYYLSLQDEEIKEIYGEMLMSPNSKVAGIRADEIRSTLEKEFKGKTEAEVKKIISELSSTMSFNPLPTGICLYDFMRGNCTNGDGCFFYNCPNYITEKRYYPILKSELNLIETEIKRLQTLGMERELHRQSLKYSYLKPIVESLEEQ